MNAYEKLAEALSPEPARVSGAMGKLVRTSPMTVSTMGLSFTGAQLGVNGLLTGEDVPAAGADVLCITLDGWQTAILICEVV